MKKNIRKKILNKLVKEGFRDTSNDGGLDLILSDPSLASIQDPQEFAHQVFLKMIAQINSQMEEIENQILMSGSTEKK